MVQYVESDKGGQEKEVERGPLQVPAKNITCVVAGYHSQR